MLWLLPIAVVAAPDQARDAPYVPSPDEIVAAMLDLADVKPGERVLDLGSGDGRIPIAAGRRGATAIGVDIDTRLVARANFRAREAEVAQRVRFRRENLFETRLRDADVLTLYLMPEVNLRLRPRILNEMQPGARVVSHAFDMGDWTHDFFVNLDARRVYLWIVPAVVGGRWTLMRADGTRAPLDLDQRYQKVAGTLGGGLLNEVVLRGDRLRFVHAGRTYEGRVGDTSIDGEGWRAVRAP
ncbi:SAM-dependent methyltransferase [Sphingomonas sp. Y38-1Y]|uniref:SAM-dependent methyltransferase n=1 Tax=Sphingomonas sp. Y38-1Y TaxID=3078265 RepID=UPI0028EF8EF9|nr:methyltransferase domain-containing protein [Sphingomonas sp. Y38-1Y]